MNRIVSQVSPDEDKVTLSHAPLQLCSDVALTFSDVFSVVIIVFVAPMLISHTVIIFCHYICN